MQAIPVVRTGSSSTTSATSLSPTTTFPMQTLRFAGMLTKLVNQIKSVSWKPTKILYHILENRSHQRTFFETPSTPF